MKRRREESPNEDGQETSSSKAPQRVDDAKQDSKTLHAHVVVDDAVVFEQAHVHEVYEVIAPHFSSTRYKPWPKVKEFVDSLPSGSIFCDVGCGNGKNLGLRDSIYGFGCDRSENLLGLSRSRGHESVRCDGLRLAYRSNVFDAALSIAVVHHFATAERRLHAVQEIVRILKPGGVALIYVWAVEQAKDRGGVDVFIDWEVHSKFDETNTVHKRYYHLFKKGELEELLAPFLASDHEDAAGESTSVFAGAAGTDKSSTQREFPRCRLESSYFDKENWCVVLRKL
jgi:tRNA (uracil-5-)-methyltransferase TRM9